MAQVHLESTPPEAASMHPVQRESSRMRSTPKELNVDVAHTILVKAIRDAEKGGLEMDATFIQRAILPTDGEWKKTNLPGKLKDQIAENGLQFKYRINDKVTELDERKRRDAPSLDDAPFNATCATYSSTLPMMLTTVFSMYPFTIRIAELKIELTSVVLKEADLDYQVTARPDFKRDSKNPYSSMCLIKDEVQLDNSIQYGLASTSPIVYGKHEKKANKHGDVVYVPIVYLGFYVLEPSSVAIIYMLSPVALILTILTTVLDDDTRDFRTHLGTLTVALIFALTQGMGGTRSSQTPSSFVSPSDMFVLVIFLGMGIASYGAEQQNMRWVGIMIGWAAFLIPLVGMFLYNLKLAQIRDAGAMYDFIRAKDRGTTSGAGKEKGEEFTYLNLETVPEERHVMNSSTALFPESSATTEKRWFRQFVWKNFGTTAGAGATTSAAYMSLNA